MPYLTGSNPGAARVCFTFAVPDDLYFRAAVRGAILVLADPEMWEDVGDLTPQEAADLASDMLENHTETGC